MGYRTWGLRGRLLDHSMEKSLNRTATENNQSMPLNRGLCPQPIPFRRGHAMALAILCFVSAVRYANVALITDLLAVSMRSKSFHKTTMYCVFLLGCIPVESFPTRNPLICNSSKIPVLSIMTSPPSPLYFSLLDARIT